MNTCNPCNTTLTNTAACESLPSQIQNFTEQFFGTVIKTEVDGVVTWSLPCNLDVGLPNNARGADEGLACYFLRLFGEGIIGLTGPQGEPGTTGQDGNNAYTVTLQSFTQPSSASPNIQVLTAYNPAILVGEYIFIQTSGWYQVSATDVGGSVFATLYQALPGAPETINAGKLVIPAGTPGASVVGPAGPTGAQGPPGSNAEAFSITNGEYFAPVGTNDNLGVTYVAIDFTNSSPQLLLPAAGQYRVTVVADLVGLPTVLTTDRAFLKLRNTTLASDVDGSEHAVSNFADTIRSQITISVRVTTTAANQTVALYGKADTADKIAVVALNTNLTYMRMS